MSEFEVLQSLPEVGITLVGFAGIVSVMGRRAIGEWTPLDMFRLLLLLHASAIIVLMPLVPSWLRQLELSDPTIWQISNGLLAASHIALLIWFFPFYFRIRGEIDNLTTFIRPLTPPLITSGLLVVAAELAAAFGAIAPFATFVFSGALLYLLLIALFGFVTLLFPATEQSAAQQDEMRRPASSTEYREISND